MIQKLPTNINAILVEWKIENEVKFATKIIYQSPHWY